MLFGFIQSPLRSMFRFHFVPLRLWSSAEVKNRFARVLRDQIRACAHVLGT